MSSSHSPAVGNPSSNFRGPRGPLQHRCGLCLEQKSKLSRCTGCRAVRYCSRDHQVQHRQEHKSLCNKIKKCRSRVDKEEHAVRNATPDIMMPANAFETAVGHFWGIFGTRDYMRARYDLAETLSGSGTLDGVVEALDHLRDMLRLCRGDNMGLRRLVPPLMLQLDQDQECYDFIKWWMITGQEGDYDWGDMDLPYLDIHGANVFEDVEYLDQKYGDFQLVCGVLLLKMKLLVDMINIHHVRKVCANDGRLPPELWRHVERHVIRSPLSHRWVGRPDQEVIDATEKLALDVALLGRSLHAMNKLLANGLLGPDEYLASRPEFFTPGSFEEMQLLLIFSYTTWWQHEGVLELLRAAELTTAKIALPNGLGGYSTWVCFGRAVDDTLRLSEI